MAGASLTQVYAPKIPPQPGDEYNPPFMGKPAVIFAIVAACLTIFMSYAVAVVRILQIRMPGIAFTNNVVVMVFSYLVSFNMHKTHSLFLVS